MSTNLRTAAAVVSMLLLQGCGGDGGGTGGESGACPSLSGAWQITAHSCNSAAIGTGVTFVQSGCTLTAIPPWTGWSGTMQPSGAGTWSGPAFGGATMTCQTTLVGATIQASCNPACEVTVVRQ